MTGSALLKRREDVIANDKDLLNALGMTASAAATLLGRSRQALSTGLASNRPYFRTTDIMALVAAARQRETLDREGLVFEYVQGSRSPADPALGLLKDVLFDRPVEPDLADAQAIVIVVAGFAELLSRFGDAVRELEKLVEKSRSMAAAPEVFIVSTSWTRAKIAGRSLDVPEDHCFGDDAADHYAPTIVIYRSGSDPGVYVLTGDLKFRSAAPSARPTMAESVLTMLPPDVRGRIAVRRSGGGRFS